MECDLKLEGGSVVDGTGRPAVRADVAIRSGQVAAVGDLADAQAARTIDCTGRTITPGFIDIHSHSDWLLPGADHGALVEPFVRQGMTTLVGGNCGFSPAPVSPVNRDATQDMSRLVIDDTLELRWDSMGAFLDALETGGVSLNVAQLVGHGSVRAAVTGALNPAPPSPTELAQMERSTRDALDAGCIGVSTGLGYPPGIFAGEEELTTFASWAARHGKLFTSHLKAYSWVSPVYTTDPTQRAHNLEALAEILRVGTAAEVRTQISHLIFVGRATWPNHEEALRMVEHAHRSGLDVAFDAFPYTAGNTTASVLFPPEMLPQLETVLADPAQRDGLKALADVVFGQMGLGLEDIQIMNTNVPAWQDLNGLFVPDAAATVGLDPFDFYCRMVIDSHRTARILIHTYSGDADDESALRAVLRHPLCLPETDTFVTAGGHQNPASYGTFPRILSTCVEDGLFSSEEAVHRMTGAVAERLGWNDRGLVREGWAADLVVFDPKTIRDRASFQEPDRFPDGIEYVLIGGRPVLDGGSYDADAKAGRVLRA